ncbi:MAG: hypothetical protein B6D39_11700 [Anaerolineae bacterium UTCFX2]|jgi:spoIIIJ-associated protein|nr:Jag N-terminal domain-containing protein [Anaerolineales bacterium]OQY88080.1 MAG: hypothetical protein B6D39_11700 [Anaerolineae bacterium UTCFX2]
MAEQRTSLEVIAPSVEEAVERGLEDLGLSADDVEVEILDSGSKGLFGLGLRQARVRLMVKQSAQPADQELTLLERPAEEDLEDLSFETEIEAFDLEEDEPELPARPVFEVVDDENTLEIAQAVVQELLARMKIQARLTVCYGEPDDPKDRAPLLVDVRGDDLSILIGPKAETLNALQYIAGLIIGKEVGHSVPLVVDVEGYRARRTQQIRQLARHLAEQAVRTGRRQVLEPMPASERRLVHIELRDHPEVITESIGEDPRRKVTIIPK